MVNRFNRREIRQIQEILLNSWPAKHYYFLNGWILRFTDGVTARANSVIPLNYTGDDKTVDKDIDFVEKAYKAHNISPIFTIHDFFEPHYLEHRLLERGYYQLGPTTHTMASLIVNLKNESLNEDFGYYFQKERTNEISEFLAKYSKRDNKEQKVLVELSNRIIIPQKIFVVARENNNIIGTLMGILVPQGFLYISDVLVHPNFRKKKIATTLFFKVIKDWGVLNGAYLIWLQVEIDNDKAIRLYKKLGLVVVYNYYYLTKG